MSYGLALKTAEKINLTLVCNDPRFKRPVKTIDVHGKTTCFFDHAFVENLYIDNEHWYVIFCEHTYGALVVNAEDVRVYQYEQCTIENLKETES